MRAARLIKDGNFSLDFWSGIIEATGNEHLARLVVAIRNALSYGKETHAIRGIVKSSYVRAISMWGAERKNLPADIAEAGDKAIKEAEAFIKKEGIRVE